MHQMHVPAAQSWQGHSRDAGDLRRLPRTENAIDLLHHLRRSKIADGNEYRVSGTVMRAIKLGELREAILLHLRLCCGDDGVGMRAKEDAAHAFVRQERRRGTRDA